MPNRSVIVALDFPDSQQALAFADQLDPQQCAVKVGFELFVASGPLLVEQLVAKDFRVFLDLKFHDIPNTVAKACVAAAQLGVWMINVHASGGTEMLLAARDAINKQTHQPILLAVTVLTSLNQTALQEIGITLDLQAVVRGWAALAQTCGLNGVVCSAQEASLVNAQTKDNFIIVTPGIRLPSNAIDDQKRIVTPQDAREAGASHIVVGRPITQAQDPAIALAEFNKAFVCA